LQSLRLQLHLIIAIAQIMTLVQYTPVKIANVCYCKQFHVAAQMIHNVTMAIHAQLTYVDQITNALTQFLFQMDVPFNINVTIHTHVLTVRVWKHAHLHFVRHSLGIPVLSLIVLLVSVNNFMSIEGVVQRIHNVKISTFALKTRAELITNV